MNAGFPTEHSGRLWDRTYSADAYAGYYTVSLRNEGIDGPGADYAPTGSGYLTLKMKSAAEINAGKMIWAGSLPNGQSISGSSVLSEIEGGLAVLPFVPSKSGEWCAGAMGIRNGQVSQPHLDGFGSVKTIWEYGKKSRETTKDDFSISFEPIGGLYDDLSSLPIDGVSQQMSLEVLQPSRSSGVYGDIFAIDPIPVQVTQNSMTISGSAQNQNRVSLAFSKSTGTVFGSFGIFCKDDVTGRIKQISAKYQGVVHQNPRCDECEKRKDEASNLPFVDGYWTFSDKIDYESFVDGVFGMKSILVNRGGRIMMNP